MASFNEYQVTPRSNRPSVESRTLLSHYQINGGSYQDPYLVLSVIIVPDVDGSPDRYLDLSADSPTFGQVASGVVPLAEYSTTPGGPYYEELDYTPSLPNWHSEDASRGIYRTGEGKFHVVHDGGSLNSVSAVGSYWDLWTVIDFATSLPRVFAHKTDFHNDTVFGITEPLNVTVQTSLKTKYVTRGSAQNIKITNEFFANNTLSKDIKSLFRNSVITNAQVQLLQKNSDSMYTLVRDWEDVDSVLSDDTMMFNFDTNVLTHAGEIKIKVRFSALEESFVDSFILVVREP